MKFDFSGVLLRVTEPETVSEWFRDHMGLAESEAGSGVITGCPECTIFLEKAGSAPKLQTAEEGYYTGLAHIAFKSTDLSGSVRLCTERGTALVNGEEISHNPGMDYINPVCPFGFGLEISRKTELPESPMSAPTAGLDHIGIPVPEINKSAAWYKKLGFCELSFNEIHRESDGAVIYCMMMGGHGVVLELFEFAGMDHEPWTDQPFASLLFTAETPDVLRELASFDTTDISDDGNRLLLKGPGGERLAFSCK